MANSTFDSSRLYWFFSKEIIDLWSQYNSKKKLYIAATHSETYFKIKDIVDKYYGGDANRIKKAENMLSIELDGKLERFEKYCSKLGIESVSRDWLYRNVVDGKAAAKYRGKINRKAYKSAPVKSIKDL